jgi:hypothetical protein
MFFNGDIDGWLDGVFCKSNIVSGMQFGFTTFIFRQQESCGIFINGISIENLNKK